MGVYLLSICDCSFCLLRGLFLYLRCWFGNMVLDFERFFVIYWLLVLVLIWVCYMFVLSRIEGEKLILSFLFVAFLFSVVGVLFALCCLVYSPQSDFWFRIVLALWSFVLIFLWVVWFLVCILSFVFKDLSRQQLVCSDVWEYRPVIPF